MSHGFSRFGPPSARDRFHQQSRPAGTLAMILPTIFATLFMFTIVVTLNKAGNMSRGGKIVRLLNVDDVLPTQLDVEQNRKKEYWEITPPPPSPEAVMGAQESLGLPALLEPDALEETIPGGGYWPPPELPEFDPSTVKPDLEIVPVPTPRTASASGRPLGVETTAIQPPAVTPDTSLPAAIPTP